MGASQRGCLYLVGALVFAFFACFLFPFVLLPAAGTSVALPVITVPAEYYLKDWPSADFELVNTLGGALLANVIVLFIAFWVRRKSNNWTREVPGRFQAAVEAIVGGLWGLTKQQAGNKPKIKNILFPLVASIFLFLLAGNWGKLLPGVESVGVLHCAVYEPVPFNGLPMQETSALGMPYFVLRSDAPLTTGTPGTSRSYRQCEAGLNDAYYIKEGYLITALDPWMDQEIVHVTAPGDTLASIAAQYNAEAQTLQSEPLPESESRESLHESLDAQEYEAISINYADKYAQYNSWAEVSFSAEEIAALNTELAFAEAAPAEGAEGEETEAEESASAAPEAGSVDAVLEAGQTIIVRPELFGEQATTRENQLYTVAPFVRGVSTDLNFTIGLALLSFIAIQVFGVSELGIGYFQKFINLRAVGNIAKNPLGGIDFVVGIFEIVSEFGKIISLSFRLFGALFAGTVLYAVILFLVGTTIPVIILGLEIIVGGAQAAVFAVLTLIFCAQAMVSHHHDDDDHGHEHGH